MSVHNASTIQGRQTFLWQEFLFSLLPACLLYPLIYLSMRYLFRGSEMSPLQRIILGVFLVLSIPTLGYFLAKKISSLRKGASANYIWISVLAVFAISLTPFRQLRSADGDGPHYLIAANQLAKEGNLYSNPGYLSNSHYLFSIPGTDAWELPDTRLAKDVYGKDRFWYSLGLVFFAAPFSLYLPSLFFFFAHSLFLFLGIFFICMMIKTSLWSSRQKFICLAGLPIILYMAQPFPDSLAFTLVACSLFCVDNKKYVGIGLCCALLLWCKPPYIIIATFILLQTLWNDRYHITFPLFLRIVFLPISNFITICFYNLYSWGHFSYSANYKAGLSSNLFNISSIPYEFPLFFIGLAGGIFWSWPFIIKSFSPILFRSNRIIVLGSLFYIGVICATSFSEAGWCPAGRYFLPILPIFAIAIINYSRPPGNFLLSIGGVFCFLEQIAPQANLPWSNLNTPFSFLVKLQDNLPLPHIWNMAVHFLSTYSHQISYWCFLFFFILYPLRYECFFPLKASSIKK